MGKCTSEEIQNAFHFNNVLMGPCPGYYGKCAKACKTQRPEVMTKKKAPFSCNFLWCIRIRFTKKLSPSMTGP